MVVRSNKRELVLEKYDPKNKDVGLLDPKVFTGQNNLYAVMDETNGMWNMKFERGLLPPALRERFTDFKTLKNHAESYFKTRNIRIAKVID